MMGIFSHQILNINRLCLAHCVLNRSFTVSLPQYTASNFSSGTFFLVAYDGAKDIEIVVTAK